MKVASDRETIAELKEQVKELAAELERISEGGLSYGLVMSKDGNHLVANLDGKSMRIASDGKSKPGDSVWVHPMTGQIVEAAGRLNIGLPATVAHVSGLGVEIQSQGGSKFIMNAIKGIEKGDRILVDQSQTMALALIEKAPKPAFAPNVHAVHWDSVGGHVEAKKLLREAIELPRKHAETYRKYGKKPAKGILMYGPPGCGKTLLARAVATSVGADKGGFLAIKGPEVLDPYVGVSEAAIRSVFQQAREYKMAHGREAVIFVDEAESLLARRGGQHNYMGQTIVPTFLTEMDGLEDSSAIVILATNRADILDPAIVRDGRVDHKIEIKRPTQDEAADIFAIHLDGLPMATKAEQLCLDAADILYCVHNEKLPHSGALIEGVVEKAKMHAINRQIEGKKPHGLIQDDMFRAIEQVRHQERLQ
jgi:proteasome-associated ATPase